MAHARFVRPLLLVTLCALFPGSGSAQGPVADRAARPVRTAPRLDVVFAIDATGSMGDEIEQVKNNLWSTANRIMSGSPRPDVRFGLVIYRDRADSVHTRMVPLTRDIDAIHRDLMGIRASGGGDTPEDVDAALNLAVNEMNWEDRARLVFLIGDAPPQDYPGIDRAQVLEQARRREIVIHSIVASGMSAAGRDTFQRIALGSGGTADVLTYTAEIEHEGRRVTVLRRGDDTWMAPRRLSAEERSFSFSELQERRLVRRAPAAVAQAVSPRRARRRMHRRGRPGRSRASAAPAAAAPTVEFDSDVGGIIAREAMDAAEEHGVSY